MKRINDENLKGFIVGITVMTILIILMNFKSNVNEPSVKQNNTNHFEPDSITFNGQQYIHHYTFNDGVIHVPISNK